MFYNKKDVTKFFKFASETADELLKEFTTNLCSFNEPLINVFETETQHILDILLPGIKRENIHIILENDTLSINVDANERFRKAKTVGWLYLPDGGQLSVKLQSSKYDNDSLTSKLENGVLTITIDKHPNVATKKSITIN